LIAEIPMAQTLTHLIEYLDALEHPAQLTGLMTELAELEADWTELTPFIHFSAQTYRRNLIKASRHYNLLVLCWKNGQRSPIHDHVGSNCALRVLKGAMTETLFEFASNGHVKATFSRDVCAGDVVGSMDTDLHQVSNLQADDAELITLHVYSPPLLVMGTYTLHDKERGVEPMYLAFSDAAGI
jgi:cysteine dioxygenase